MNWLIIRKDFSRNKVINITLLIFVVFSTILASVSIIMGVQTFTSISELYEEAQPPHFLQMHKGEIDQSMIDDFMSEYDGVVYWQSVEMLNVEGSDIQIQHKDGSYDLSENRLDIGFVQQNPKKDLLLNADHEVVQMEDGEIGIPILLKEQYGIELGDVLSVTFEEISMVFTVTEFILDAQMNSPMVSSTRILISDEDFSELKSQGGETEYIIEVYLNDKKEASSFQSAYENANLPQDGQAVTYSMIFLLSAMTDIMIAFVLLLVSTLLVVVSFICVKFTIMAALEEELTEIGTMKAIGLPFKEIRSMYLLKYKTLAILGIIIGYAIALASRTLFTDHITRTFGHMQLSVLAIVFSLLVCGLLFLIITVYAKTVLNKLKSVTVVDSLVRGEGITKKKAKVRDGLHKSRKRPVNVLIASKEIRDRFRSWRIIFSVVILSVLMMMVPINLMNTFESPEFITYMGSSLEDVLIELDKGDHMEQKYAEVISVLENDQDIEAYYTYRRVRVQTMNADEVNMNLYIDTGENAGKDLRYISGGSPKLENELAISYLNQKEIGKEVGDTLTLYFGGEEVDFLISGVYQDVTSGGFTAKSTYLFSSLDSQKYTFSIDLQDSSMANQKAKIWAEMMGSGVSVDPMDDFIDQTLGGVVRQLSLVVRLIVGIGAMLVVLISVLYLKLRLVKDYADIAIMKAIGFTYKDLTKQYLVKMGMVTFMGIVIGVLLTKLLGERVVNLVLAMSNIGLQSVGLISNPLMQYVVVPFMVLGLILLTTYTVLKTMKKYNITTIINE